MRVIDTPFGYCLTWHREKNRGTQLKPSGPEELDGCALPRANAFPGLES
jgi:hypothetical protein